MIVHRGEIYYADLSPVVGSEQGGVRPVLIVQNDVGNKFSPTVIAAAITSQKSKADLPTHISVDAQGSGLLKDSIVLLEQVRTLDKHRLREKMGRLDPDSMNRVDQALSISLACALHKGAGRRRQGMPWRRHHFYTPLPSTGTKQAAPARRPGWEPLPSWTASKRRRSRLPISGPGGMPRAFKSSPERARSPRVRQSPRSRIARARARLPSKSGRRRWNTPGALADKSASWSWNKVKTNASPCWPSKRFNAFSPHGHGILVMIDQAGDPLCLPFRKPQPGKHLPGYSAAFRGMAVKWATPSGKRSFGQACPCRGGARPSGAPHQPGHAPGRGGCAPTRRSSGKGSPGRSPSWGQAPAEGEEDSGVLPQNRGGVFPAEELCQLLPHPFVREGLEPAFFLP